MRTIKFRAWDKRKNEWIKDFRMSMSGNIEVYVGVRGNPQWQLYLGEFFDLMQFTGLRDKNGKEIYEGDIYVGETVGGAKTEPKIVEWKNSGYEIKDGLFAEVIGNIYENPELLNKPNNLT